MLKAPIRRRWLILTGGLGAALLLCVGLALRLAAGPIGADWLKPGIERSLAAQVDGGRARIGGIGLAWFGEAKSLGLQLSDVRLTDARGRAVVRARRVQTALALDGFFGFTPAPGRIAAEDFFVAVSVSPRGRYELGYDAAGAPDRASSLARLWTDLTGRERMGRPVSFLRQLELRNGRLALRETAGPVSWVAEVRALRFHKTGGRLKADADLSISRPSAAPSVLKAQAEGAVGLGDAFLRAEVRDLVPARVFPSAGATRPLSALDAVVRGRGSLAYGVETGVRAADLSLEAGSGTLRFAGVRQAFEQASVVADFDPRTGEVALTRLLVAAEKTRADVRGRFRLVPEDRAKRRHARLEFDLSGPRLVGALAPDAPSQEMTDVVAKGRYVPARRRLELTRASARLPGAVASVQGALFRNRRGDLGADLTARLDGVVGRDQVFAFWPRSLGASAREWLREGLFQTRISNAVFTLDAPAGAFRREVLRDEELKLAAGFADTHLRFSKTMPAVEAGAGSFVLQGNRFELALTSGRLQTVALSEGTIEIARLKPPGQKAVIKARAVGGAQEMLRIVDGGPERLVSRNGFSPDRVGGLADVRIEIERPLLLEVAPDDVEVRYDGMVRQASVARAALGWDLTGGELKVEGTAKALKVVGTGDVGPYRGGIDYAARFDRDGQGVIELDGLVRASVFGGAAGKTVPLDGRFTTRDGSGEGTVRSPAFNGRLAWKKGDGPDRFTLDGQVGAEALRAVDAPFMAEMPDRFRADLTLVEQGGVWRGDLDADALSGAIAYTPGERPRLVYQAELTPIDARRLGFGRLPLFEGRRTVVVDTAWTAREGTARVAVGGLNAAVGWTGEGDGADRTVTAALSPDDLAALGVPSVLKPGATLPVSAVWRSGGQGLSGTADLAGTPVRFQTVALKGGARLFTVSGVVDRAALRRWGAPQSLDFDGTAPVTARWTLAEDAPIGGRVEADLAAAYVGVPRSDWRKPAGKPGRLAIDFVRETDGDLRLSRIAGSGAGFDVEGSAALGFDGRLVTLDLSRARFDGLLDASVRAWREPAGSQMNVTLRGKWLDARRLFDNLSETGEGTRTGAARAVPVRVDAALDGLRLTDQAVLREVRASGLLGVDESALKLDLTAATTGGGKLKGRLFPLAGATAVSAETDDAGDVARTLFGIKSLKGGRGTLSGRLVPGGADLNVEIKDVRLVRAPTMAQILTMASLQGLADTLNGEGVLFTRVVAPVQVRGRRIVIGEARATGSALGLTTKGVADLGADTVEFEGTIAPAYALNSAIGAVPVVGQLLVSRVGEGVVGLGYSARGSFDKPQVTVNPLSLVTPGILRRIFESGPTDANAPAKPTRPPSKRPD